MAQNVLTENRCHQTTQAQQDPTICLPLYCVTMFAGAAYVTHFLKGQVAAFTLHVATIKPSRAYILLTYKNGTTDVLSLEKDTC